MDHGVRQSLQRSVSNYIVGGGERAGPLKELSEVAKSGNRGNLIAMFEFVLYWVRSKHVGDRLEAVRLLSKLVPLSIGVGALVAKHASKIASYTVGDLSIPTKLRREGKEMFLKWYAHYFRIDLVRRAARALQSQADLQFDAVEQKHRWIEDAKQELHDLIQSIEENFSALVPRFDDEDIFDPPEPNPGPAVVPPIGSPHVAEGMEEQQGDIEISLQPVARNETNESVFQALKDQLQKMDDLEERINGLLESTEGVDTTDIDALWDKVRDVREKSRLFDIESSGPTTLDMDEWEEAELSDTDGLPNAQEAPQSSLADRIGPIADVSELNAAILRAVGVETDEERRGRRSRTGRRRKSGAAESSTPKSRIHDRLIKKKMGKSSRR